MSAPTMVNLPRLYPFPENANLVFAREVQVGDEVCNRHAGGWYIVLRTEHTPDGVRLVLAGFALFGPSDKFYAVRVAS